MAEVEVKLLETIELKAPVKKTRKQKKEKEKEPTFLPPFFSKEYFDYLIGDQGLPASDTNSFSPHLILKWKNEEYLPLYSLNLDLPNAIPFYEYRNLAVYAETNPSIWEQIRIGKIMKEKGKDKLLKYFKYIWNTKNYRLLSFFGEHFLALDEKASDFKEKLKALMETPINLRVNNSSPNLGIQIPEGGYRQGTPRLINKFKFDNKWRWTQIKQTGANWMTTPMYLTNLGFIARQSFGQNEYPGNSRNLGLRPVKPLVCIVFKKEYFSVIKAYILANEPIPTEYLQLWVDKSLEDPADTSQNIKSSYVRQIRNPYKKLGVEIVIKDSLVDELYSRPELKRFRTHQEQINWIDNILQNFTIKEKERYRIS